MLRTAVGTLALRVGAAGTGFINGLLLARLLGPAEFGIYAIVLSAANVAATLAMLGLPVLATREAAADAERGQWNRLKGFLRATHRWTLLAVVAILGVSVALLANGDVKLGVPWTVTLIAMILVLLSAFNQLRAAILRGLHWVILADIPELLLRPLVMLMLLLGTFLTVAHLTAAHALAMQLGATSVALAAGTWWLMTKQPDSLKTATPEPPQRAWLSEALPFLGIAMVGALGGQVSLYLLGYLAGAKQAGLFQAANQLVGLIVMGLAAVNMPLQPSLAAAWARDDKRQVQRLVTETARMGAGIGFAGAAILLIFADAMLGLYGPGYSEASNALRILAIGQIVNAAAGSCGILLMMTGHQTVVVQGNVLALLLNITVAYLAIPQFGMVGGALASALGMMFWNGYFVIYAMRVLGVNTTILSSR